MRKCRLVFAIIIGLLGVVLSLIMLVTAFRFREWGRVMLYLIALLISLELSGICFARLLDKEKD